MISDEQNQQQNDVFDLLPNQQRNDVFDLLPDALVLEIFNRVQDAKSLSNCMSLCKRFGSLVPQTDHVRLTISRPKAKVDAKAGPHSKSLKGFIGRVIFKPFQTLLQHMVAKKSKRCSHCDDDNDDDDYSFTLPNDMLKSFEEIRSLNVRLPSHEGDVSSSGSGALLKWNAEFGKELESCVILGATGFHKSDTCMSTTMSDRSKETSKESESHDHQSDNEVSSYLTNKQLKKRVVWTISCLIASSARHHMLKQIVSKNRMIRDVEIGDGSEQGTIRMGERQVVELRQEMDSSDGEIKRTEIPAVTIKMWYVPVLELPESGYVMKGATLAVVRPAVAEKDDGGLAMDGFGNGGEKWYGEAVRKLIRKKKAYTLEMNSF